VTAVSTEGRRLIPIYRHPISTACSEGSAKVRPITCALHTSAHQKSLPPPLPHSFHAACREEQVEAMAQATAPSTTAIALVLLTDEPVVGRPSG
jgi:hypothetical protein